MFRSDLWGERTGLLQLQWQLGDIMMDADGAMTLAMVKSPRE